MIFNSSLCSSLCSFFEKFTTVLYRSLPSCFYESPLTSYKNVSGKAKRHNIAFAYQTFFLMLKVHFAFECFANVAGCANMFSQYKLQKLEAGE